MYKQILIVLTLCILFAGIASANGGIGNETESTIISIGSGSGYVTIPLTVTNATNAGSVDITVSYDPAIAKIVSVSNAGMDSMFSNIGDGFVRIGAYQTNNPGLNDDFIVAQILFASVSSSGTCPLEVTVTTFKDATPTGLAMAYTVSNGTYTATADGGGDGTYPPTPTPTEGPTVTPTETPTPTPTEGPTVTPTKILPDNGNSTPTDGTWMIVILLVALILLIVAYIIYRGRQ